VTNAHKKGKQHFKIKSQSHTVAVKKVTMLRVGNTHNKPLQ